MISTINSFNLGGNIPNARLVVYPDVGHGSLFPIPGVVPVHATPYSDA